MADLLVDTDVFIDHLRGTRALRPSRHRIRYSAITRYELFSGAAGQEQAVERLLAPFGQLDIDTRVAERAGRIRRQTQLFTPDALIAATALEHRLGLATRNRADFDKVRGLRTRSLS